MPLGKGQQAVMEQPDPSVAIGEVKIAENGETKRWAPSVRSEQNVPEVDRVFDVIDRENERVRGRIHNILLLPDESSEEKVEMLKALKLEATRNVKSVVHIIRTEISIRLDNLRNHPTRESVHIQNETRKVEHELARFDLFCTNFFGFKLNGNGGSGKQ